MPTIEPVLEEIDRLSAEERRTLVDFLLARELGDPPNVKTETEWLVEVERRRGLPQNRREWKPGEPVFGVSID